MQTAIDELQEEISEMQKDYEVTTIYAQTDGVVFWLGDYQKEQTVEKNAVVAIIGKEDGCCIAVNNKNQQLSYGNTVSLEYTDADGNSHTAEGTVVTAGVSGVSAGLKSEYANLRVSAEVRQEILDGITVGGIRQYQNMKATVTAQIRQMPGVLAVPRSAVTEINGKTYVYVQNRDGTVTAQSFIAGGSDKTAYWVLEGLEEGMILCSE
jgi:multidrug efflux pump subunit AcrA (membrane-fusion protein)